MNYMNQVAEMLGVEIGEKFSIDGSDARYVLRENGMVFLCSTKNTYVPVNDLLIKLLNGRSVITNKPYFPFENQTYYCVAPSGNVSVGVYNDLCIADRYNVVNGNCYRTESDAEKHIDHWVEYFKRGEAK